MRLHQTLLSALVASAAVLAFQPAVAAPVFKIGTNVLGDTSLNDIELINRENIYRAASNCVVGGVDYCLPYDSNNDPSGYRRANPSMSNNVWPGDLFIGVLNLRNISNQDTGNTWTFDGIPPGIDEFSGYFVQQVQDVATIGPNNSRVLLKTPTVADPFGVLNTALGQSAAFWVDDGPGATAVKLDGGLLTTFASIASATDGQLWAILGIGADNTGSAASPDFDGDGYAYSEVNISGGLQTFGGNFYTAYDILVKGPAFNLKDLRKINDPNELSIGGSLPGDPLAIPGATAWNNYFGLCTPTASYACNDIVGNGQLTPNQNLSPWMFASEDPLQLNAVPEPATLGLLGLGLLGLGAALRRRVK